MLTLTPIFPAPVLASHLEPSVLYLYHEDQWDAESRVLEAVRQASVQGPPHARGRN